jgi:heptosyltransferase-2
MRIKSTSFRKILVRAPNWVGDAVMAEPAIRRLRSLLSHAHLAILARPGVASLYEGEGLADEIIATDIRGAVDFIRESRQIRNRRFDMAVLLQNAFGAALLSRAAGIRRVAGYPTDRRRLLLDPVIPLAPNYKTSHQVFYYLRIASVLESLLGYREHGDAPADETKFSTEAITPRLSATAEASERAIRLLAGHGIRTGRPDNAPLLVLNPGATNSRAKQWLPERFAEVADRLAAETRFQTVIVGGSGDCDVARTVAGRMRTPAAVLAGKTDLSALKGVLAQAALLISNDTGAAHVGAALGIPTAVVFGPTEQFATHPYSSKAIVVRHPVECSPCMLRDCPIDHRCMTSVQVEDVCRGVERLLGSNAMPVVISSAVPS